MNRFTMVATVAIVAGVIYIGSYLAAYGVLYTSPQNTNSVQTSVTQASSSTSLDTSSSSTHASSPSSSSTSSSTQSSPSSTSTQSTLTTTSASSKSTTTSTSQQSSTTSSSSQSSTQTGTGGTLAITLIIGANGWNNTTPLSFHIPLGAKVTLTILYQDPNGDQHPLFLTGYNVVGPTMSLTDTKDSIQFTASQAGTFSLLCLNPDCNIHDLISGTMVITVS